MIYVDDTAIRKGGRIWSHLVSDDKTDNELHEFASRLGLQRRWFQGDHYDVTQSKRTLALKLGATAITARESLVILKATGKR